MLGEANFCFDLRVEAAGRCLDSRRDAGATTTRWIWSGTVSRSRVYLPLHVSGRFRNTALTPSLQRSSIPTTAHSISGEM